jgi:hypothetical protein
VEGSESAMNYTDRKSDPKNFFQLEYFPKKLTRRQVKKKQDKEIENLLRSTKQILDVLFKLVF